ncbi:Hydrogenase expression/formation protein [Sulfobacillus acidophilus TPY]|uniref:Hydrogenase maturation protease n=1 Tax=Sulfobacillus acidophilus (strain ATCC 700253 / DSM 10332 / NAL) TaxID=679936 RepID=G8U1W6_SULAD|nr:Hydrogenase expression/formation protein [Sulfobacillus acidophilus TPY]AEW07044.1 hydrogenase maturation protease [Sulfobacillus acidophilus DSM 10332]
MEKILILGLGNILFSDEGLGVHMAHYLQEKYRFEPAVDVMDGGTLAYQLMDHIALYDHVLIVDAALMSQSPGSIFAFRYEDAVKWGWHITAGAHEIEIVGVLTSLKLLGELPDVQFIAMEPYDIVSTHIGLSPVVRDRMTALEQVIIEKLGSWGIQCTPVREVSFDRSDNDLLDIAPDKTGKENSHVFGASAQSRQGS